ncbi:hypothetical protein R4K01_08030 [Pseudomonas aeruginosa]|uniref:hypothetical protein n=1 Tax=Pseudomonas aeruginosa TaxID=287 RepID=UPI0013A59CF2|nr:hypothetical protein [Pseudomonas aeruginosa]MDV7971066.1 hypothetical protein [Pseudomonas aeruginosa]
MAKKAFGYVVHRWDVNGPLPVRFTLANSGEEAGLYFQEERVNQKVECVGQVFVRTESDPSHGVIFLADYNGETWYFDYGHPAFNFLTHRFGRQYRSEISALED